VDNVRFIINILVYLYKFSLNPLILSCEGESIFYLYEPAKTSYA